MLDNDGCGPIPLVNSHTNEENCEYTHIQVELTCPAQLPPEMNGRGAAFRVIDLEGAPLLPAAVRLGTFLYLYQIKAILSSLEGVPPLAKGSGSGKNGAFVKLDYAVQLVKFLFGDCDVEDQMHMVRKMCYPSSQKVAEKEQVILDYLACLDVENQEAFKEMKGLAQEEIQKWDEDNIRAKLGLPSEKKDKNEDAERKDIGLGVQEPERKRPASGPEPKADAGPRGPKRTKVTPKEFHELFPTEFGKDMKFFHDPANKVYRVSYPSSSPALY